MLSPSWSRQSGSFALFFFAYYGYIGAFTPYASLYFSDKGISAAEIGVLMSLMQVMRIFGPNLWGWLSDITERRVAVLRLTALGALCAFSGLFVSQTFAQLFLAMVVINFFTSAQGPLSEGLMLSEMRGDLTNYGKVRLWGSVGFIAAAAAAGQMLDWWGITLLPWIAAALLAMVLFSCLRMTEPAYLPAEGETTPLASLLARRDVRAFFVSTFLMIAAHQSLYAYYSLYLAQIGYSNTVIGLMWSLGVVAEIVFFYYQAPIFRRFGVRRMMVASLLIAVARFLMIGYGAASIIVLVLAQVLHAATFGAHHSASVATLQRWFAGALQGRGQALFISISYGLGGSAGGLLLSGLWDTLGSRAVYLVSAVLALAATAAAMLSYRWQSLAEERK